MKFLGSRSKGKQPSHQLNNSKAGGGGGGGGSTVSDSSNIDTGECAVFSTATEQDPCWRNTSSQLLTTTSSKRSGSFLATTRSSLRSSTGGGSLQRRQSTTSALAPQARRSNDLSTLTIDKLNFAGLAGKLYGRDEEVKLLQHKLERLMSTGDKVSEFKEKLRHCILIEGYSGTGKTALARSLLQNSLLKTRKRGLFVQGKFDLNSKLPYSGISEACAAICGAILDDEHHEDIAKQLQGSLGTENTALLMQIIPVLGEVVQFQVTTAFGQQQEAIMDMQQDTNKSFAFLKFLEVVSQYFSPLVVVLDDLQWAGMASLELLQVLLTSLSTSKTSDPLKLMVVGTYRSNEVDETHIFHRVKDELLQKNKQQDSLFEMTEIQIGNLDTKAVQEVICDLLAWSHDHDDEEPEEERRSQQLAGICMHKTHGNIFFVLQFLAMLHRNELLKFNFAAMTWKWDDAAIEASTSASENVVDLLKTKIMTQLPSEALAILRIAACLGSSFEESTLSLLWERITPQTDVAAEGPVDNYSSKEKEKVNQGVLNDVMSILTTEGYLVETLQPHLVGSRSTGASYVWAHDKIHEAALALVPSMERYTFRKQLGDQLLQSTIDGVIDTSIFTIVNLLNASENDTMTVEDMARIVHDESETYRVELAKLNLVASKKAMDASAFDSAAQYVKNGIQWLPESAWKDHKELALSLHTTGAKCHGYLGDVEPMEKCCSAVIDSDCPFDEKLDVYIARIDSLANRTLFDEAKATAFDILKRYRCRFPENSAMSMIHTIGKLLRHKGAMKSHEVDKLQPMTDPTRIKLMKILDQLGLHCYCSKDDRVALVFFKSLEWTLRYGYCAWSPTAFATSGVVVLGATGDLQRAYQFAQLGLELQKKLHADSTMARHYLTAIAFIYPWQRPIQELLKPLLEAYDVGMRTGDTESGLWCIFHWIIMKMLVGSPLEALDADSLLYTKQMIELKRDMAAEFLTYMRQVFLNLRGKDNVRNPTNITGVALSQEALERHQRNPFQSAGIQAYHGILLTYFGEHESRADWLIATGHDYLEKTMVASINTFFDTFLAGLSCFAAAQHCSSSKRQRRKYIKFGEIMRAKVKKWVAGGNPNVKHYEALLDAESIVASLSQPGLKKHEEAAALQKFEMAIMISTRGGYQHDAALANERLGEFRLYVLKDEDGAAFYFEQALKHWGDWGAIAKVEHLREKYKQIFPKPSGMVIVPR